MIYKLTGVVQHYDWGGYHLIPSLLGKINENQKPWAEYWLGTHPKGPAIVTSEDGEEKLSSFLTKDPSYLGKEVLKNFGGLPFLFKVLDVRQMLSIQLHPTKQRAEIGFELEEKKGIPRLAPNRNYKDRNHKPEVMVALSDFWLLHGFKRIEVISEILQKIPTWNQLSSVLESGGLKGLYEKVMSISQDEVDQFLKPLFLELSTKQEALSKHESDYWAWQAFQNYTREGHYDRGIFSIYFFNLVYLKEGEGIFQDAGIPHAYLAGVNIELMANSDNVLRGGLTPKHIDVVELLDNVVTKPVDPKVLSPQSNEEGITNYYVPVNDFSLDKIELTATQKVSIQEEGPSVYLVMKGAVMVNGENYQSGKAFFVGSNVEASLAAIDEKGAVIFKAYA